MRSRMRCQVATALGQAATTLGWQGATAVGLTLAAAAGGLHGQDGWKTDFSRHTVPLEEIVAGGPPKDGIPAIDEPKFVAVEQADRWLDDREPFSALAKRRVIEVELDGRPLVVFWAPGTASALDAGEIARGRDVGATGVFDPIVERRRLTFRPAGDGRFTDREAGSTWTISGRAMAGPLAGSQLWPVAHGNHFWFAWSVFRPNTLIVSQ